MNTGNNSPKDTSRVRTDTVVPLSDVPLPERERNSTTPVDINQPDLNELAIQLKTSLGDILSKNQIKGIVKLRESGVIFQTPQDLLQVRGIGPSVLEPLTERLRLGLSPLEAPIKLNFHVHGSLERPELTALANEREQEIYRVELSKIEPERGVQLWVELSPSLSGVGMDTNLAVCRKLARDSRLPVGDFVKALTTEQGSDVALRLLEKFYDTIMGSHLEKRRRDPFGTLRGEQQEGIADLLEGEKKTREVRVRFESPSFQAWRLHAAAQRNHDEAVLTYLEKRDTETPITAIAKYSQCLRAFDQLRDRTLASELTDTLKRYPSDLYLLSRGLAHRDSVTNYLAEQGIAFEEIDNDEAKEVLPPSERYFAMGCPDPQDPEVRKLLISHWLFMTTSSNLKISLGNVAAKQLEGSLSAALYALSREELDDWWLAQRPDFPPAKTPEYYKACGRWLVDHSPGLVPPIRQVLSKP
ncbi:MAG: helix-hairpin-helix domain-containing protein [Bdellovibrionales bacterium]|nr:helix-hairpin-helix domain-containing protein [Bdellovibrionales bacterium]